MDKVEILAPVGGAAQLEAAIRCGADAVYLGGKGFNARRNAENFGAQTLAEAVSACHARGVRVHVTVNTLVLDSEMEALAEELKSVADSGADAVIVQDMAVLDMLKRRCPEMELHASTQAVAHNVDSAKYLQDLGFQRVVLARELSLREIETIASRVDVELEAFVHGALCTCVSGACYLSSMLGGRSGNRGLCAQPCRLDFRCGSQPYAISLKDMSHIGALTELVEAGVSSFKIEGRMKRPEYVAAAVTACRNALEGKPYDLRSLRQVFSRSGFTRGYLDGQRTKDMQGIRTKEDSESAASVLGSLRSLYRTERQSIPVDMQVHMRKEEPIRLTVFCEKDNISVAGEKPQQANTVQTTQDTIRNAMEKCGGTPFFLRSLSAMTDEGLFVSNAQWNALRKEALGQLLAARMRVTPKAFLSWEKPLQERHIAEKPFLRGRFGRLEQIGDSSSLGQIVLPVEEIARHPECIAQYGQKLVGELPAVLFPEEEERINRMVEQLHKEGLDALITDNVYGITAAQRLSMRVHGGAGLNITNSQSLYLYENSGLSSATVSFELSGQAIRSLRGTLPRGAIGYGYLPLMRLRRCPNRQEKGCGSCNGRPSLVDRKNISFPLVCHERRYTTMLNSLPLWTAHKPLQNVDFVTLYFTIESPEEVQRVIQAHIAGANPPFPHTYGLYGRSIL